MGAYYLLRKPVVRKCLFSISIVAVVVVIVKVFDAEADRYVPHHIKSFGNLQPHLLDNITNGSFVKTDENAGGVLNLEMTETVTDHKIIESTEEVIDHGKKTSKGVWDIEVTEVISQRWGKELGNEVEVTEKSAKEAKIATGEPEAHGDGTRTLDALSKGNLVISESQENAHLTPQDRCELPPGGFRAWKEGVVTTVSPEVAVNCSRVFSKDREEISRIKKAMTDWNNAVSDDELTEQVKNCSWLRESFDNNLYNSDLENSFPIAFTFVVYNSPYQVLRLLRLLYRPQNTYCIHPDVKSKYKEFFISVASCFDNVIISSQLENVVWGYYTILAAQMNCIKDLLEYRNSSEYKWKYVINLCGKELPLYTNREIVSKLMKLNGSSSIVTENCGNNKNLINRIIYKTKLDDDKTHTKVDQHTKLKNRPFDLSMYHKSSSYNALSYQFSKYLLHNSTALEFYEFFKNCSNPEEHFYATLFMMPGVPGGFNKNIPESDYFRVAGAFWVFKKKKDCDCHGKLIHNVCIITAADLSLVVADKEPGHLFVNKYFSSLDHTVMSCMEERIVARNQLEYQSECGL